MPKKRVKSNPAPPENDDMASCEDPHIPENSEKHVKSEMFNVLKHSTASIKFLIKKQIQTYTIL